MPASSAVTVKLNAPPEVAEAGAETVKCVAPPASTEKVFDVAVIDPPIAVIVWTPRVLSVAGSKTPTIADPFAGSVAEPSVLVKDSPPEYTAVFPNGSKAVTRKLKETPANTTAGA